MKNYSKGKESAVKFLAHTVSILPITIILFFNSIRVESKRLAVESASSSVALADMQRHRVNIVDEAHCPLYKAVSIKLNDYENLRA